jgi:DUF4097 and DUF4098 domain-containing protein YvlB
MGAYPPPPQYPPPGPPYGGDWKYQRQVLKQQARAQRDMIKAQRDAYRYQLRGLRRSSIVGPFLLLSLGVLFLLVQSGHIASQHVFDWYSHFWPLLLVGAGIVMLIEWGYDQHIQSDPTQPRYRRRLGGGVFTLLVLLIITGVVFSGVRQGGHTRLLDGMNINQDNWDEFLGDKHESDQTLTQALPAGGSFSVDNPRGNVTISGTSDDSQVHIAVHKEVYTRSDSDADSKAQHLSPSLNTSGNTVSLTLPQLEGARADLTISLPPTAPVTITANHGDVTVNSVKAPVNVTANHGDIALSAITGPVSTHINNGDSSFSAHSITGPINLVGHGRDTTLSDLSGPVSIDGDFFGTAHFEHIRGPLKFHTSRTDFQLTRLDGDVNIDSDLSISEAVGPLILTTGNRNVTLERIAGDISVTNRNGSVDVTGAPPLGNINIQNRNGSVDLTLPEQSSFSYQFDATNGDIESDFSEINVPEGGMEKKNISGTVGKGGSTLRVTTSQGDIALKKASIQPLPPMPPAPPHLTALPPDVHQSIADAKEAAREAKQQGNEAAAEARQQAKEAAAEAKRAAREAKELKQQNKDQN